jgi:carbamoyl-phosphate synthase large subunit
VRRKVRVLFASAGRRVELIRCFRQDAADLGLEFEALACDLDPRSSSACSIADRAFAVPRCTEAAYVEELLRICDAEGVDLVVPTIDPELEPLAAHAGRFLRAGTMVHVSDAEVVRVARDKAATARVFRDHGVAVPRTSRPADAAAAPDAWSWPVIAKPRRGSSSKGIVIARGPGDLGDLDNDEYVVQELLAGREFTVSLFFDRDGRLRSAVPHWRRQVRAGEVEKGVTVRHAALASASWRVAGALPGARGALCFQAIVGADGEMSVFELNARFGGGYPLAHRAGARFSRWLLAEVAGLQPDYHDSWREGVVMLRYDAAVFHEPA